MLFFLSTAFLQSKAALLKAMGSEWLCGDRFESLYEGAFKCVADCVYEIMFDVTHLARLPH